MCMCVFVRVYAYIVFVEGENGGIKCLFCRDEEK
jgi:hypothetical protein